MRSTAFQKLDGCPILLDKRLMKQDQERVQAAALDVALTIQVIVAKRFVIII
jgi:hypothetical protein